MAPEAVKPWGFFVGAMMLDDALKWNMFFFRLTSRCGKEISARVAMCGSNPSHSLMGLLRNLISWNLMIVIYLFSIELM